MCCRSDLHCGVCAEEMGLCIYKHLVSDDEMDVYKERFFLRLKISQCVLCGTNLCFPKELGF